MDTAKNFAKATVAAGYAAAATSVDVLTGHGAKFPAVPFNAIWWNATDYGDPSDDPSVEVVRVTAISTDTLTVTRAQESTSASNKNTSGKTYKLCAAPTAKLINSDIMPLVSTTKGDLPGFSTVPARLAVGTDGQVLTADAASAAGIKWAAASGGGSTPTGTGFRHVTSGTEDGATVGETGTGNVVRATSPTLVTPALGVATATSVNGSTVPASDTLVGRATTDTLTNKTLTSPTLTAPALGAATATSINKVAITAPASGSTLTIADGKTATHTSTTTFAGTDGKTVTISNSLTFAGTDGTTITFQGTDTYVGRATTDTLTNKTLTTPTIASFTNATHDHSNAAGGGQISAANLTGTLAAARMPALTGPVTTSAGAVATTMAVTFCIAVGDEVTDITSGTAKVTFRMPHAMTLTAVRASLTAASSSGIPTVDINQGGTTIMATNKLTIDANEKTSTTAAAAAGITTAALTDDAEITIDIDVPGTGAKGLKVYLIGTRNT